MPQPQVDPQSLLSFENDASTDMRFSPQPASPGRLPPKQKRQRYPRTPSLGMARPSLKAQMKKYRFHVTLGDYACERGVPPGLATT
jgi:hypothetical protein